ncbi:MAG: NUDIX domain-containing protein [Treponema sp.]|nr:NUDIX domain-containing protein [Treponema sp.]MCL2250533.1 NUDIX domain-containing protein [Treponema sp.]
MFNFCPSCSSKKISFKEGKIFRCPDCGFVYYHNIAAATGCLIIVPDDANSVCGETELCSKIISGQNFRLVFLVRGKEPSAGKLDLPGGFVDIGEGVFEGLYRELQEEIRWTPCIGEGKNLKDVFSLFASFSNVYKYKGIDYNTCDMYFSVIAPNLKPEDLYLEKAEVSEVRFLKPEEIDFSEFAFPSTIKAVKTFLNISF